MKLLQALGIFQRETPDHQLWKLTRPENRHDKLTRDNLLVLEDYRPVRIEPLQDDQWQVVGTHSARPPGGEAVAGAGGRTYLGAAQAGVRPGDWGAAGHRVRRARRGGDLDGRRTSRAAIGHRFGNGYVQRADLVVWAPAAGVPVMLLEIDRRIEDARDMVHKLRAGTPTGSGCSPPTRTSAPCILPTPGRTRSSTSITRSGRGAGSTRRPARRACRRSRSCSRTPRPRRSPTRSPCRTRAAVATGRRACATPITGGSRPGTTAKP